MPNWVYNTIDCSDKNVLNFIKKNCLEDGGHFTFDKLLPMPTILKGITCPTQVVPDKKFKKLILLNEDREKFELLTQGIADDCISESANKQLLKEYGAVNWYDWACNTWGCKWDASGSKLNPEESIWVFFTPWSPPTGFINVFAASIAKEYPELTPFTWEWEEEQGFGETLEISGGKCSCIKSWKQIGEKEYNSLPFKIQTKEEDVERTVLYYIGCSRKELKIFSENWKKVCNETWRAESESAPFYTSKGCHSPLEAIAQCMELEGAVITEIPDAVMPLIQHMDRTDVFDCLNKYQAFFSDDAKEQILSKAPCKIAKRNTMKA